MKFRPGEEFEEYWARVNRCEFDLAEPDELKDFFDTIPGRIRDAFTPYATQWENPPAFNHRFWKGYIAQRNWLDAAISILTEFAHKYGLNVAPFRYFTRLIHGEKPRESDQCRAVVDAVRDVHLAIFGTDGEYVLIWDREADNLAESTPPETALEIAPSEQPSPEARAIAVLSDHPDWTDTKIAEVAGCSRTSLYRFKRFTAARELLRHDGLASQARGRKVDGNIEAWDAKD